MDVICGSFCDGIVTVLCVCCEYLVRIANKNSKKEEAKGKKSEKISAKNIEKSKMAIAKGNEL